MTDQTELQSVTLTYEVTAAETKAVSEFLKPLLPQIRSTPALESLLYDIDLLPEQIKLLANVKRLAAVCMLWKALTEEQISELMRG